MRTHTFIATVHLDRFSDLAHLMATHRSVIFMQPWSIGPDNMAKVQIFGEEDVTLRLERSIARIADILSSPLAYEEA